MSPLPPPPYPPNAGLVAAAWLAGVDGLSASMVASSLPRDFTTWADLGFVQYTVIPGLAPVDSGDGRLAMVQIDAWAVQVSNGTVSEKRPLGRAWRLAELILRACEDDAQRGRFGKPIALPANYAPARVLSAWPMLEPAEVPDDPGNYARVTFDLALKWARI